MWAPAAGLSLTRWHGSQLPPALWAHCRPCGSRPGARCEACRRRSQRQAPLGVRQLEPDAEAGGGRALGAPHRGWLPWHSRDRKPRRADLVSLLSQIQVPPRVGIVSTRHEAQGLWADSDGSGRAGCRAGASSSSGSSPRNRAGVCLRGEHVRRKWQAYGTAWLGV